MVAWVNGKVSLLDEQKIDYVAVNCKDEKLISYVVKSL